MSKFPVRFAVSLPKLMRPSGSYCISHRSQHSLVPSSNQNDSDQFAEEWKTAMPYEQLPGPTRLSLFLDFMPGGKYSNRGIKEVIRIYHEKYGSIYKIPGMFGKQDIVFTFDPKDYQTLFRTEGIWPLRLGLDSVDFYRHKRRPDVFINGGLGTEQGKLWADMRSAVNPVMMQTKIVQLYIPTIDKVADDLIQRMKVIRDPVTLELPANFEDELNRWTLEAICVIALDTRLGLIGKLDKNSKEQKFINAVKAFFRLIDELDVRPSCWKVIRTPKFYEMMNASEVITEFAIEHIQVAKKNYESRKTSIKNMKDVGVLERLIEIDSRVATVMGIDMITAGVDTTSSGLVSTLYNLALNPDKQELARQEVLEKLPQKDSRLTAENMKHMPYLRACIKESFRLTPVVDSTFRGAGRDLVLQGYRIPEGTGVAMQLWHTQMQDHVYNQAAKFLPERWLRSNKKSKSVENEVEKCPLDEPIMPFTYLPFGFGPRMCIGKRFAELEIEALLSRILRNFRIEWHHEPLKFRTSTINSPISPLQFKMIDCQL